MNTGVNTALFPRNLSLISWSAWLPLNIVTDPDDILTNALNPHILSSLPKPVIICYNPILLHTITESENYEIIEWFGLEGTLKIIWFQSPCHGQAHLPPDQVAQSPIQSGLEQCQGGGSHSFSGQPVRVPHHLHGEEFLFYIDPKSTIFQSKAIPPCPITACPCKKSLSSSLIGHFR